MGVHEPLGPMLSGRLRRAGAGAVAAQGDARRCDCSPRRRPDSVVGAHQLSNVAWSVLFDDVELTAAEVARLARQARPLVQSTRPAGSRSTGSTSSKPRPRSPNAKRPRSSPAPRSCATASASTAPAAAAASSSRATAGRPTSSAGAGADVDVAGHPAGGLRRRAAHLPGRGAGVDRVPRRRRARRLPRPRHGSRQDADRARPPRPHDRSRHRARHRPGRGRRQLGRRGRPLHAGAARRRAPRRLARRGRRSCEAEIADADVVITTYATAVRDVDALAEVDVGDDRARRGAGDQEPGERDRPAAAPDPRPHTARAHRHADRERPRRPVGDPRLHQPRSRRRRGRSSSPSSSGDGESARCVRSTASWCSGARRASRRSPPSCPTRSTSSTTAR